MEIDAIKLRAALWKWLQVNPMTMTQLAEEIGINQLTLNRFRTGKTDQSMATLFKITKFLHDKGIESWNLNQ